MKYLPIVILSLILVSCGHSSTADMEAAHKTSVDAIVQEFLDAEAESSKKYVDQIVEITGPVFEVEKADGKIIGVKLSSDEFAIVNCTFQDPLESLPEGDLTLKGVCSGFMGDSESLLPGGTVELKRCAIVQ